ncbi:serine/threonine protein kinase [Leptolyngbya sp. FACHB-541]|uniref:serine/threonine-protein kinase n=1 Tax=Leptolyngbya sp. FACHB-541 TaxID=2692810 RepID=UPI001689CB7A|nr:serine/threonine-protein kinase [Leptolyngbya sp. FACHB-541]MBD1995145.1 serine/threonine protein kinase [Leptolyngbya sp. FACHB-541]
MALSRGAKKLFEWLKQQRAGTIVSYKDVMDVTGWSEVSLTTYIGKNKVAPFLQKLGDQRFKLIMDGNEITESFFDETFTQTTPRQVKLSSGEPLQGQVNEYKLVEPLGNGAVGHVWSAQTQLPGFTLVAAKVMLPRQDLLQGSKLPNVRERFRREARNGRELNHPNVVKYIDVGEIQQNPFLVMELANRSIADKLCDSGLIPEEEAAEIILNAAIGLDFLHSKECPHRDIKPANLLEFSDAIKLGDLGIVKWSDFDPNFTGGGTITLESMQLGSWFYMAPEQQESPHNAVKASDIYALGVTWIQLLTGKVPSPQAIGAGRYQLPEVRSGVAELLANMLRYNPTDRPSLIDIQGTIQRSYLI